MIFSLQFDLKYHSSIRNKLSCMCNLRKNVKIVSIQSVEYYLQSKPVVYEVFVQFLLFSKRATAGQKP